MNHDFTHCMDYRKSYCPKDCFRAQLTKDLMDRKAKGDLLGIPMSFAHFKDCDECLLKQKRERKK